MIDTHAPQVSPPHLRRRLRAAWLAMLSLALGAAACSNMSERERGTAQGAGAGAVAGAVLGSVTGGSGARGAVIGGAIGAVAGNLWSKRMEDKRRALEQSTAGTGIAVDRTTDNRLKLNVPSDVSFDTGRADIKPAMRPVLDDVGRQLDNNTRATIVGHTDSTGSAGTNQALSQQRAQAVRDYLVTRGVNASHLSVEGRGSREPVASNDSDSGRAANRRVEIFLADTAS